MNQSGGLPLCHRSYTAQRMAGKSLFVVKITRVTGKSHLAIRTDFMVSSNWDDSWNGSVPSVLDLALGWLQSNHVQALELPATCQMGCLKCHRNTWMLPNSGMRAPNDLHYFESSWRNGSDEARMTLPVAHGGREPSWAHSLTCRAKSCTWAIWHSKMKRNTNDPNVESVIRF